MGIIEHNYDLKYALFLDFASIVHAHDYLDKRCPIQDYRLELQPKLIQSKRYG